MGKHEWWLAAELRTLDKPLHLCHHPLGNFDISDNVWFKNYQERAFAFDRKETLEILETNGPVVGTITGHSHQPDFANFHGMPHVSLNAFSKETPDIPIRGTHAEVHLGDRVTADVMVGDERQTSYTLE